jgi:hypothetical protein
MSASEPTSSSGADEKAAAMETELEVLLAIARAQLAALRSTLTASWSLPTGESHPK